MKKLKVGYDYLSLYTCNDLEKLYLNEGKSKEEAKERARILSKELNRMSMAEWRSWKKRFENEPI